MLHVDVLFKSKYIYWVEFNLLGKNGIYRSRPNGELATKPACHRTLF